MSRAYGATLVGGIGCRLRLVSTLGMDISQIVTYLAGDLRTYLRGDTGTTTGGDLLARRINFNLNTRHNLGGTYSYTTCYGAMDGYRVGDLTNMVLLGDCGTQDALTYLVFTSSNIAKDLKDCRYGVSGLQQLSTSRVGIRTIDRRGRVTLFGIKLSVLLVRVYLGLVISGSRGGINFFYDLNDNVGLGTLLLYLDP